MPERCLARAPVDPEVVGDGQCFGNPARDGAAWFGG
jgi:hypothetical protein